MQCHIKLLCCNTSSLIDASSPIPLEKAEDFPLSLADMLGTLFPHSCPPPHLSSPLTISSHSGTSDWSLVASRQLLLMITSSSSSVFPETLDLWESLACAAVCNMQACAGSLLRVVADACRQQWHGAQKQVLQLMHMWVTGAAERASRFQNLQFHQKDQCFNKTDRKRYNRKFLRKNASLLTHLKFLPAAGQWWLLKKLK